MKSSPKRGKKGKLSRRQRLKARRAWREEHPGAWDAGLARQPASRLRGVVERLLGAQDKDSYGNLYGEDPSR